MFLFIFSNFIRVISKSAYSLCKENNIIKKLINLWKEKRIEGFRIQSIVFLFLNSFLHFENNWVHKDIGSW